MRVAAGSRNASRHAPLKSVAAVEERELVDERILRRVGGPVDVAPFPPGIEREALHFGAALVRHHVDGAEVILVQVAGGVGEIAGRHFLVRDDRDAVSALPAGSTEESRKRNLKSRPFASKA